MSFWNKTQKVNNLLESRLFDETSFYKRFVNDLLDCKEEVIIESPYITSSRMNQLYPVFRTILNKGIKMHIITRNPAEHFEEMRYQATNELLECEDMGINIMPIQGHHHRKLAILDKTILWEGSLNILSQNYSQEIMRRINCRKLTEEMIHFLKLDRL